MENNFKVAKALLAGLVAGVAIGILLADEKGTDTRGTLTASIKNLAGTIKDKAIKGINKLTELKAEIADAVKAITPKEEHPLQDDLEHA